MKKEQPKIRVLRTYYKDNIYSCALNKWFKKYRWLLYLVLASNLVWLYAYVRLTKDTQGWQNVILALPFIASYLWFFVIYYKEGKNFWNSIKDKPQPVDLDNEI